MPIVPAALATGATLCVVEQNLSGYRNTGELQAQLRNTTSLQIQRNLAIQMGVTYTGVNFADVARTALYTDGNQQTQPNTTVTYGHPIFAGTDGVVSF